MIRLTAPRPDVYDLGALRAEADAAAPGCLAVNEVGDLIAAYWNDNPPDSEVWAQIVAAHIPPQPELDPVSEVLSVLAQLSPDQLQRVVTLGVMVTEAEAVDILEAAVGEGDAVAGVAVVAEAAAAAQASVAD